MCRFNWREGSCSSASGFSYKLSGVHSRECCLHRRPVTGPFGFSLRQSSMMLSQSQSVSWSPLISRSLSFTAVMKLSLEFNKALLCSELFNGAKVPTHSTSLRSSLFVLFQHTLLQPCWPPGHSSHQPSALLQGLFPAYFLCYLLPPQSEPRSHSFPSIKPLTEAIWATTSKVESPALAGGA